LTGVGIPPVHAAGSEEIQVALIGCGGRGSGAAMDALATAGLGPIKLVAMADASADRLQINVSFLSAVTFCRWLASKTGKRYRLPTEAEWELACRAGATGTWTIDDALLDRSAWHAGNSSGTTHPVGKKLPNRFGLCDMLGNAGEWATDLAGKPVLCGGTFLDAPARITPMTRRRQTPGWQETDPQIPKSRWWLADGSFVGFRIVCEPTRQTAKASRSNGAGRLPFMILPPWESSSGTSGSREPPVRETAMELSGQVAWSLFGSRALLRPHDGLQTLSSRTLFCSTSVDVRAAHSWRRGRPGRTWAAGDASRSAIAAPLWPKGGDRPAFQPT
jgi:hypothetical protein